MSQKNIPNIPGKHLSWSGVVFGCFLENLVNSFWTSSIFECFAKCDKNISNFFNSFVFWIPFLNNGGKKLQNKLVIVHNWFIEPWKKNGISFLINLNVFILRIARSTYTNRCNWMNDFLLPLLLLADTYQIEMQGCLILHWGF